MPSCLQISISLLSWPSEIQWQRSASDFDFFGGFFLDGDDGDLVAQLAGAFEGQEREAAVAGDQAVASSRSLLNDAALAGGDELEQFVHFGAGRHFGADAFDGLRGIEWRG